mmetsp:Transcript_63284/g.87023  ORF Transcript_63284/g.87023 Transcript_63284/m.87023 type:complete len:102 (+) Transcript_63284:602-907(+)
MVSSSPIIIHPSPFAGVRIVSIIYYSSFVFAFCVTIKVSIIESQLEGTSRSEGKWALYECIYYAIVTATTVGFGDVVPQEETSQMLATIYIPYLYVPVSAA